MDFKTSVSAFPFVGSVFARRLARLDVKTLGNLLYHFPHRYDDFRLISKIRRVQIGEVVTLRGKIISIKNDYTKRGKVLQNAEIEDDTGKLGVIWFNQRYLARTLKEGMIVSLSGKVDWFGRKKVLASPDYEILRDMDSPTLHTGRLVPIYPETASLSSKWMRNRIANLLPQVQIIDFLPKGVLEKYNLVDLPTALQFIHFPKNEHEATIARQRFAFEEFFLLHLTVLARKKEWSAKSVRWKIKVPEIEVSNFISNLPFELTRAQRRSIKELLSDLTKETPMNRLLEGDVGSGKTVVAAVGAYVVAKNGLQAAIMAPTQILATQHYNTLKKLLDPHNIKVELVTGSTPTTSGVKNSLHPGGVKPSVIVGTHALLHSKAKPLIKKLAFVVIDEQHKFGVEQRAILLETTQRHLSHILTMTATPIPRTIALTLYGDLDLSVLDELPPGRQIVTTWLVPHEKREGAYGWVSKQIESGSQAFIVCPLIEESEIETMKSMRAATVEFKRLKINIFPDLKLGLLHGRMKSNEKDLEIEKFRNKETDILVSTPVVEVGIDIPNATVMMIETAERFGLAQLHQLRGRVGRGDKKSYCLLFTDLPSPKVIQRLKAMQDLRTGADLAELDLRLRGPGELFGTKQHGAAHLKVASFSDLPLIHKTKEAAEKIFPEIDKHHALFSLLRTYLINPN